MYTEEQIKAYLDRIGYTGKVEINLECLAGIVKFQQKNIPYETLDIINSVDISLDEQALYNKIVINRRGGFCFEMQGILCHMLRSMGFRVKDYFARFPDPNTVGLPMRRHRILAVTIDGKDYLSDAGVRREVARCPLEITEGKVQSDGVSLYRLEKDEENILGWKLMQKPVNNRNWKMFYSFTDAENYDIDFVTTSYWCEKSPDSPFQKGLMAGIFRDDGHYEIVNGMFKRFADGKVETVCELESEEQTQKILRETFKLKVPEGYKTLV